MTKDYIKSMRYKILSVYKFINISLLDGVLFNTKRLQKKYSFQVIKDLIVVNSIVYCFKLILVFLTK